MRMSEKTRREEASFAGGHFKKSAVATDDAQKFF
jgi:hypothetical protein